MPDQPDPPRKFYKFKPKEFENVNGVRQDNAAGVHQPAPDPGVIQNDKVRIDVRDLLRAAHTGTDDATSPPQAPTRTPAANGRIDVHDLNRIASAGRPLLSKEKTVQENEIHDTLRDNLARANSAGLNTVAPLPKRPGRRKRDYIITLVLGNILLLAGTAVSPVFGAAGLIIFNLGVTWIMWFVMDPY